MLKEKITKNKIIATAFQEWSKSCFWQCSLQSVSDALNISKTALYRYFRNKESLLSSMEKIFITELSETIETIHTTIASMPFQKRVRYFFDTFFSFFSHYPYYLNYLIFHHIQNDAFWNRSDHDFAKSGNKSDSKDDFNKFKSRLNAFFLHALPVLLKDQQSYDFSFIYRSMIFFFPLVLTPAHHRSIHLSPPFLENEQDIISLLVKINMQGFSKPSAFATPDYETVEGFFIFKEDLFSKEKLFDAVYEVVSSEGLHKASVSKIATRLGIQKSSLYHYFKSKSELIKTLIRKSSEKLDLSINESIGTFQRPADKLYCLIIVSAAFFYYSQSTIHLFSWLIFNKLIDKEYFKIPSLWDSERYTVFKTFFKDNMLNTYDLDPKLIFSYLNFNILASILSGLKKRKKKVIKTKEPADVEKQNIIYKLRTLYSYFLYGILGGENEKK